MNKRNLSARLSKTEKAQALKECREYDRKTFHTATEAHENSINWMWLKSDHYTRLRLMLNHIAKLPVKDALSGDALDGKEYRLKEYAQKYDDMSIDNILQEISGAQAALEWLQGIFAAEKANRKAAGPKPGSRVLEFPNTTKSG